ncbi:MAG: rhomboid family intramembrane serine protease [Elusimicrobiota bacterium]|nr:rhomboid family intramembrane serine protease [Elusimicrobiota bacterium]
MTRVFRHDPVDFNALPPVIKGLMGAQVAGFVISWVVGPQINDLFGLVPRHVLADRWVWQPFTYLFLHGGFWHLLFNLFALWMFGMPVESQWGGREFLKYYFLCGLGAALCTVALSPGSPVPTIGSSGSVYGLIVAFAMLYPDAVIYLYFLIPVRAIHMAVIFAALEFFSGLSGNKPGVANFAHFGGMLVGWIYIRWWWTIKLRAKTFWRGLFEREEAPAPRRPPARRAPARPAAAATADDGMAEVDRILDKILASGLESLTDDERAVMKRYSDKGRPS